MENNTKKHSVLINDKLYQKIKEYCDFNELKLNEFVNDLLRKSFLLEQYGDTPFEITPSKPLNVTVDTETETVDMGTNVMDGQTEYFMPPEEPKLVKLEPEEIPTIVVKLPFQEEDTRTIEEVFEETLNDFKQTNDKPKKRRLK